MRWVRPDSSTYIVETEKRKVIDRMVDESENIASVNAAGAGFS